LALGFVGLALMAPMILCTLPAGQLADRRNRKSIILGTTLLLAGASLGLTLTSAFIALDEKVATFQAFAYTLIVVIGIGRTFLWPASAAFVTSLVTRKELPQAITFNSGAFQLSCVIGPAVAGAIIWLTHSAWIVYGVNVVFGIIAFLLVADIKHIHKIPAREPATLKSLITGFEFVWKNKIILGIISLDMFAVLLGGAVTLLPIFAEDIIPLHSGAEGLGLGILRAAIPIGAIACMFYLAHRQPLQKVGPALLWCVAMFGVGTVLFGLANHLCLGLRADGVLRRGGQRQRGDPRHAGATAHARRETRPRLGGEQPVHWHFQRTRRLRIRRHPAPVRPSDGLFDGHRCDSLHRPRRLGHGGGGHRHCLDLAGNPPLWQAGIVSP
jgi:MFS family permease